MRKFYIALLFCPFFIQAQVAIDKASVDGDGILDFPTGTTKGIILPIVTTLPTGSNLSNGMILMDYTDKKVKMRENNQWVDLSKESGNVSQVTINTSTETGNGVVIGDATSTTQGVLVLESNSKALILPKIDRPHLNVVNPYPGMICYDTYNKALAVFNGSHWYFWK